MREQILRGAHCFGLARQYPPRFAFANAANQDELGVANATASATYEPGMLAPKATRAANDLDDTVTAGRRYKRRRRGSAQFAPVEQLRVNSLWRVRRVPSFRTYSWGRPAEFAQSRNRNDNFPAFPHVAKCWAIARDSVSLLHKRQFQRLPFAGKGLALDSRDADAGDRGRCYGGSSRSFLTNEEQYAAIPGT